jgi:hypothetical protein
MGLFSPSRNVNDPKQLAIAAHELGHGFAWKDAGLTVHGIRFWGDGGECGVKLDWENENQAHDYAIGCWGGFEAEDKWLRKHGRGAAKRSHSSHDIDNFRFVARQLTGGLSESKARSIARTRVSRHWSAIQRLTPQLVRDGRISI